MTSQQALINGIITGMKKAVKRTAYDSDSDSSIEHLTNRGNKLRKKSRYVHQGQLAAPTGPQVYKRRIEYSGYSRDIISINPPLLDENGREVDTEDEDEREAASPASFNPYAEVRIEQLLAPLTSAADLPLHPTLSKPFVAKALTELTQHAGDMVQREKASLWRIKHLLTRLSGDDTWMPCESVETENDFALFLDEPDRAHSLLEKAIPRDVDQVSTRTLASEDSHIGLLAIEEGSRNTVLSAAKVIWNTSAKGEDIESSRPNESTVTRDSANKGLGVIADSAFSKESPAGELAAESGNLAVQAQTDGAMDIQDAAALSTHSVPDGQSHQDDFDKGDAEDGLGDTGEPAPRRMRTRAQAQAASENTASSRARSISPDLGEEMFISPYFLAPRSSHPDRDLGLPANEADEVRRLLQLYIQKQEEVCRGLQKVYDGLMRAERYRKLVMKWAKAEAHVGAHRDMSDGEDWYDKEEWGLDEDLKKGQDEEEEDAATTAKKTRTRRQ